MADDTNLARAAEIDQAIKAADKVKADAAVASDNKLDQILSAVAALAERVGAVEAAGAAKPDAAVVADPADAAPVVADAAAAERGKLAEMADIQARADSVAQAFGGSAPRFMDGETPIAYRTRLAGKFQKFSEDFKGVDLQAIAGTAAFAPVEQRIYADALEASKNPEAPEVGLREIVKVDPRTGQRMSMFYGRRTIFNELKSPSRYVQSFTQPRREAV